MIPSLTFYYGRVVEQANATTVGGTQYLELVLAGNISIKGEYWGKITNDLKGSTFNTVVYSASETQLIFSGQSPIIFAPAAYTIHDPSLSDDEIYPQTVGGGQTAGPSYPQPDPSDDRVLTVPPVV